jgi:YegS/Rv2252/BmrU family lipid kinase
MKKLLFLYNPHAGKGQIRLHLASILNVFAEAGYLTTVWPTRGRADATWAAAHLGAQFNRVICCGGDGTLNETVTGLLTLEHPPALGYIPAGTTNDFAKNLSLPQDIVQAARMAATGVLRPCDMGRFNERAFVYVAAFGAFTDVSYDTPQQFKNAFGHLAYLVEAATRLGSLLKGYHMTVIHDGETIEGDFVYGMVSNTVSVGGFQMFPPSEVALDDGQFEVVLVHQPKNPAELQDALLSLARQTPDQSSQIQAFHARQLTITARESLPWTLDGEYGGSPESVEMRSLQQALTLVFGK